RLAQNLSSPAAQGPLRLKVARLEVPIRQVDQDACDERRILLEPARDNRLRHGNPPSWCKRLSVRIASVARKHALKLRHRVRAPRSTNRFLTLQLCLLHLHDGE